MSSETTNAAKTEAEAAQEAVTQARETATMAIETIRAMTSERIAYLGCLTAVVVFTLIFDMASFAVETPDVAVPETVAQAQREMEAKMNSWSYSVFSSSVWGKLTWFSALAGIGLTMTAAIKKLRAGWVPLATIGCAMMTTLLMMLLFFVGFPDLSAYSDASCSATMLGYWVPLLAAIGATSAAVKPILYRAK